MKKLDIGITLNANKKKLSANGNNQNAVLLKNLLEKTGKYNIHLVSRADDIEKYKPKNFLTYLQAIEKKIDILLCPVFALGAEAYEGAIEGGVRLVDITYGNVYGTATAELLEPNKEKYEQLYSANHPSKIIWTSPHYKSQMQLYQVRQNAALTQICPYIWSPIFLLNALGEGWEKFQYKNIENKKSVAIYEPNLNFNKNLICPAYAIKAFATRYKIEDLEKVYFYGIDPSRLNHNALKKFISTLHPPMNSKITLRARHPISEIFSKSAVSLSHHVENGLNYTTLESLFLNLPVVHNSDFFEAGYVYEGYNVKDAADKLFTALNFHQDNIGEYEEKAKEAMWECSPDNPAIIDTYIDLIEEVMDFKYGS